MGHVCTARRALAAVLTVAGLVAALAQPAGAGVTDNKTFTVDVTGTTAGAAPDTFAGDADATVRITITNTSSSQSLGSANITVPSPFAVVSAEGDTAPGGPVIELRDLALAPGAARDFALTVDVQTCSAATASFGATAKQSNEYNGVGNDFTLEASSDLTLASTGTCRLAFVTAPTSAERDARITSVPFQPLGAAVTVEARDAGGTGRAASAAGTVALSASNPAIAGPITVGDNTAALVAGLATFATGPTLAKSASGYTMTASAPGYLTSAPSSPAFTIVDDQVTCGSQGCQASAGGGSVTATFGGGSTPVDLLLSVDAADAPLFECAGYPRGDLPVSQFLFTSSEGDSRIGTMVTTIADATRPLKDYEVCWAAPYPFASEGGTASAPSGVTKPATGEALYVGILPDCAKRNPVAPCVSARTFTKKTKTVTLTVLTDGRDPWRY